MNGSSPNGIFETLLALLIVVAAAIVVRIAWRWLLARRDAPALLRTRLADTTATPVFLVIVALAVHVALSRLVRFENLRHLQGVAYVTEASYIFVVFSVTWLAYGFLKGACEWYLTRIAPRTGSALEVEVIPIVRRLSQFLLIFVALTIVLDHHNFELRALLGVAGVASLAGALAAQETLANMIAGFMIMIDRPFRIGDRVELSNGRVGDVYEIGLRSTRILSFDHTLYIIPNSELAKSSVVNLSYPSDKMNVRLKLVVAYGNDLERVKQTIVDICRAHPLVLADPAPGASLSELRESSLEIGFNFWVADYRTRGRVQDEINTAIYERIAAKEILWPSA